MKLMIQEAQKINDDKFATYFLMWLFSIAMFFVVSLWNFIFNKDASLFHYFFSSILTGAYFIVGYVDSLIEPLKERCKTCKREL